ncbi:conserved hypothetical protein [Tenacibaculum litopenaei]|uniref:asparagine synthase (glutamine-hydrolyzing) n=1 Tax=Tenacibaculum litopenaei TaxID=396016 RepID=UPI003894ADAC
MCGILGYISKQELKLHEGLIEMEHRGPDAQGIYEFQNLKMGHRRLSIIDLNEGANQPFIYQNQILVFNGEIYNYKELKAILLAEGVDFQTESDTEVLLHWLIKKGIEQIGQVEGMFSFAWFNETSKKLFLVRDSLGIKPLYVYQEEGKLIFSSEIKSIFSVLPEAKRIDESCLAEYLLNGFIYEPETGFKNIRKIAQAGYEVYDLDANLLEEVKYWNLSKAPKMKSSNSIIEKEIDNSIREHLVADVPVGLFFSGGIDSSIILSQTRNTILPITVKSSENDYKEAGMSSDYDYAMEIGKKLNIDVEAIPLEETETNDKFLALVEEVAIGNEELIADFTYQSSKLLSEKAKAKGLTVMISGMGADEIMAGYPRYKLVKYDGLLGLMKPLVRVFGKRSKWMAKKAERFQNYFDAKDFSMKYTSLIGYFSMSEVESLLESKTGIDRYKDKLDRLLAPVKGMSKLRKAMYLDYFGFLSHNFSVSDKSSMQASIELRVPLATKRLYELSWNLKDIGLIDLFKFKKPLRAYLLKYLPKKIVDRKKAGFNPPMDNFIYQLGFESILEVYRKNGLFEFVKEEVVREIAQKHFDKRVNNTYKLYQLLHFSYWLKNYAG